MSEPAPTFFELQTRARRRSLLLLVGSFLILWVAANIVTSPWHLDSGECVQVPSPTGTGTRTECPTVLAIDTTLLIGTVVAVVIYLGIAYLASGRAALALAGARRADGPEYAMLRNLVEEMSIASGTRVPQTWVVDDPSPNAFATGRNERHAAVTVTTGMLHQLSRRELGGVIAHEIGHIKNRDIAVTTFAVLTTGAIAVLADLAMRIAFITGLSGGRGRRNTSGGIALVSIAIAAALYIIALPAALLLKAALSRERERLADASAIQYTRDPSALRSALEKLEADPTVPARVSTATAHLWIEEPKPAARAQRTMLSTAFDTHPPIAQRIAILRRMEGLDPDERGPNDAIPGRRSQGPSGPTRRRGLEPPTWPPPS